MPGIPLFIAAVASLPLLVVGIGVVPVPMSLLTDPATWRDLLWTLVNAPVGVALGALPAFLVFVGGWTLLADAGTLLFGWWNTAPPGFWLQVFLLSALPAGVLAGPRILKAHAQFSAALLAPTFTDEGLKAAIEARAQVPGLPVLVLSQHVEQLYARELLSGGSGGLGYLLKDRVSDVQRFIEAVRTVAGGGTAMDPEVISQLLARRARDETPA